MVGGSHEFRMVGDEEGSPSVDGAGSVSLKLQLTASMWRSGGKIPNNVSTAANFGNVVGLSHCRHLITTLVAHQKLATLSSKRPRENGKMRASDWSKADGNDCKMKGAKRIANVATVVVPILIRWANLWGGNRRC